MSFAERIRSTRIDLGLTQEELGKAVGVSGQAVSKWESMNAMPDPKLLPALADALGTTIDALFGHEKHTKEMLYGELQEYLGNNTESDTDRKLFDVLSAAVLISEGTEADEQTSSESDEQIVHIIDHNTANGLLCTSDEFLYLAMAHEPTEGWSSVLCFPEISEYLAIMADPDVLKCVLWLLGQEPKLIETVLIPDKCGADVSRADEIAEKLVKLGAITVENVNINGIPRKLARTFPATSGSYKPQTVAFLTAACVSARCGLRTTRTFPSLPILLPKQSRRKPNPQAPPSPSASRTTAGSPSTSSPALRRITSISPKS